MEQINKHEQGSTEWLEARSGRATSSVIHRITAKPTTKKALEAGELAKGAQTFAFEKAIELLYGIKDSFDGNDATEWGNDWESTALAEYEKTTFGTVERTGFIPDGENAGGSPDAIEDGSIIIDFKCPFNQANFYKFVYTEEIEKAYYWQLQDLMRITGCKSAKLVYFNPHEGKKQLYAVDVPRNEDDIAWLNNRIEKFVNLRDEIIIDLKKKL